MPHVLDLFRLDGRVALVTGAAGGLGESMSLTLAQLGASVALAGRNEQRLTALADRITTETGQKTAVLLGDVAEASTAQALAAQAADRLGPIDILLNNAGINIRRPTVEYNLDDWRRVLDINLSGPFYLAQAVAPAMLERGWGRVINVTSTLGRVGLANRPAYTASKGGLEQLTRTLALEWAARGVTVNALAPGPFLTPINDVIANDPDATAFFMDRIPMARWGQPWELAGAIAFLASDASSFVTGAVLFVDGGWTAQ